MAVYDKPTTHDYETASAAQTSARPLDGQQMFAEYGDVLTVKEACQALKIGKNRMYELLKSGKIKYMSVGKKFIVPRICLIDFINTCREESIAL